MIYYLKCQDQKEGDEFEKHPLHYASLGGEFMQSLLSLNIISGDLYIDILIIGVYYVCQSIGQTFWEEGTI